MLKLEQFVALVVAAGLAIVSYMLFFSWAGGGGYEPRQPRRDELSRLKASSEVALGTTPGGRFENGRAAAHNC
ncbi:MAG: hypothetical protein ACJ0GX_05015 [Parasynechococcus sp.]|uniref:hypothetical protein n=1 Tax=Parasynechococcus sp. TaxID=3101203 RepID=UPI000E15ED54|nr:MAG: hypothetical protein DBW83_05700 [Synechococcus sp. MED-G69]